MCSDDIRSVEPKNISAHPQRHREPGLEELAKFQAGTLSGSRCLTNRAHRVNFAAEMKRPSLQPLLFEPILRERVWGGRRLESAFGKNLPPGQCIGESWEIVDRPEAQSVVRQGPFRGKTLHELWQQHREEIFGAGLPDAPRFPDFCQAARRARKTFASGPSGEPRRRRRSAVKPKPRCGISPAADPGAQIYAGLRRGVQRTAFEEAVREGRAADLVHRIEVKTGDAFFVPSGRLHAIDAGNLLIEIQQNSDTTYRVFDWNRSGRRPGAAPAPPRAIDAVDRFRRLRTGTR